MRFRSYTYLLATIAVLSACQKEEPVYTVGEADNVISLSAGAYEGGSMVMTKAGSEDNHEKHGLLTQGTQLRMQVIGTWTGKADGSAPHGTISSNTVTQVTTATVGAETATASKHNAVTFNETEKLYWDDYGTADPANKTSGRVAGLTIYAAAVDGVASAPVIDGTAGKQWNALNWSLDADQNQTDWVAKDLLVSNNIKSGGSDGCYKFDEKASGKILEFKHAMSKITINLKANNGFPSSASAGQTLVGNTPNKFEANPEVYILSRNSSKEEIAYAMTNGNVNVTTGVATGTSESKQIIKSKLDNVHPAWDQGSEEFKYTVQYTALVYPGTVIGASGDDAKAMTIAKIVADGNVYYIDAEKISLAINGVNDYKTESGKNYILNINVNKTDVDIAATVAEWTDVTAAPADPKIDITTNYGDEATSSNVFSQSFSLYVSKTKEYTPTEFFYGEAKNADNLYAENRWFNTTGAIDNKLYLGNDPAPFYWPNHNTYYYFRGVYPRTKTNSSESGPGVTDFVYADANPHQGILVQNAKYNSSSFPSSLMIGIPSKKQADGTWTPDEGTQGISATEGKITLNFTYRMAQVEVRLVSSGYDSDENPLSDNIDFGEGSAEQAVVSILNGYDQGYVLLKDGSAIGTSYGTYVQKAVSDAKPDSKPTAPAGYTDSFYHRHDAVIPQSLTGKDGNPLKFQIVTGPDGNKDTYTIDIKDIIVSKIGNDVQPKNTKISEWEAGKHYVYTLKITKTKMKIEATIVDWIPVVAGGDFWL